jgi:multicomponent Na+:H+ antiporter subunit D
MKKVPAHVEHKKIVRLRFLDLLPSIILGGATILMGIFAATVFDFTLEAAESLLNPVHYLEEVLSK